MHAINFKHCKKLVSDAVAMHNKLLEYKYEYKKSLTQQAANDERALLEKSKMETYQIGRAHV